MNYRLIARILSRVSFVEAVLIAVSACVALYYREPVLLPYGIPILALVIAGFLLSLIKPKRKDFFAREGFIVVSLAWIYMSVLGTLPFYISGAIPSFIDGFFETVSGLTTTGATILTNVEAMPKGLLFWRSFTHWIGGMGVLVFLMAVVPIAGGRSMYLMRAETPGPTVGKLVPRAKSSAAILYGMYVALTLLQFILLWAGGMPIFDSITTAFGTAGTGGFSVRNQSILAYHSPYAEIVVTIFMLLFGLNFSVYYLLLARRPKDALRHEETHWYLGIFAAATLLVTVSILPETKGFWEALRLAAFQNASIMTSTGYATADFALWPVFSQMILLVLMCIGASSGSTGGGFKVSRVALLLKAIRREVSRMVHPRSVAHIKFEHKTVEEETIRGVLIYLAVYVAFLVVGLLVVSLDGFDHTTTFSAVLTTFNNIGPGLGPIGPMGSFSIFSPAIKLVLSALMLLGRLEIFPLMLLVSPSVWRRR